MLRNISRSLLERALPITMGKDNLFKASRILPQTVKIVDNVCTFLEEKVNRRTLLKFHYLSLISQPIIKESGNSIDDVVDLTLYANKYNRHGKHFLCDLHNNIYLSDIAKYPNNGPLHIENAESLLRHRNRNYVDRIGDIFIENTFNPDDSGNKHIFIYFRQTPFQNLRK